MEKRNSLYTPHTPPSKRCEFDSILNLLSQGFNKKQIREKLNISSSNLSNHLRRLENSSYIERKGKYVINVLKIAPPNSLCTHRVTKNQTHFHLNKRGHAYNFKVVFPKEQNLIEKEKVQHEFKVGNLQKLKFGSLKLIKDRCSIWINKGSLTIYSNNSYYSGNALYSKFRALKDLNKLIIYLKDRFGFGGIYGIEIFREHYGLILNKFAQWILKRGGKLYVKEKGNKTILWVDNSREDDIGLKEFESEDPMRINSADNYFQSHERTNWKVTPEFILTAMNGIQQNQIIFDKNMQSHIEAVKNLGDGAKKLGEVVEDLVKQVKKLKK
jgi:hypothetical protein